MFFKTFLFSLLSSSLITPVFANPSSNDLYWYGYSWGGFESLALHQEIVERGYRSYLNLKKDEHIVRLHIGLEDPKDLIDDLKNAMKHIK